jgi:hypothetical protein
LIAEEDRGVLAAHHAFWDFPKTVDLQRTITEMLFVPEHGARWRYLLGAAAAAFHERCRSSRPVLYALL